LATAEFPLATLVGATTSQGYWRRSGERVLFYLDDLAVTRQAQGTLTLVPRASDTLTNSFRVAAPDPDPAPHNNTAVLSLPIRQTDQTALRVRRDPDGLVLEVLNAASKVLTLQTSTDFNQWSNLGTADMTNTVQRWPGGLSTNFVYRFFRAKETAP
jgi:hypothetical protein